MTTSSWYFLKIKAPATEGNLSRCFFKMLYARLFKKFLFMASLATVFGTIIDIRGALSLFGKNLKIKF